MWSWKVQYFTEQQKVEESNMNIGIMIIAIVGGATGLLSTAYLAVSFPAVILRAPCRIFLFYFYSCTGSQFSSTSVAVTAIPSDAFSARITR